MSPADQSYPGTQHQPEFFSPQVREASRFYLDLSPPNTCSLAVVCGGREDCNSEYAIHRADFPYFAVEFVARGKGFLNLVGREYTLVPGTLFTYGPGVPQHITGEAANPLVKYFVDFAGSQVPRFLAEHALSPGSVARVSDPSEIQNVFDDLIRNGLKNSRFSSRLCDVLLEYLLLKIADLSVPGDAAQSPAFATYRRCRRHIQSHYVRLKTLAQIAKQCHLDPAYLCRLFRRYDHRSPYQFLLRLKMNQAAGRLVDPDILVKQVAAELGFEDPCHFSRAFKSVFGLSPESFRQLL
jgi:AraC-like DNA-binding protein/quercetin dioxygenase-like cupin family protein